ncbi:MAG: glycosyltransferase, partial [Planctomycetota bacterium]
DHFEGRALAFVDAAHETLMSVVREPAFCGDYDYDGLIKRVERETGVAIADHAAHSEVLGMQRFIAHQYLREEAIRAAARWADETGGRFHLYGQGWHERAEFARFARGPVEHGRPLGRAFRAAKISLHAGCNSALHQRVLDGLCAGGFFLIQEKPSDLSHALNHAILRHVRESNLSPPFQLRPADLPAPNDAEYRRFLRLRGNDPDEGVTATREMLLNVQAECEWGCRHTASSVWPRYRAVVYQGSEGLADRIAHFLSHEDERQSLASEMREAVLAHFTYDALARSLLEFMGQSFAGKAHSFDAWSRSSVET